MTPWKYSADGKAASRLNDDGRFESRLISAIPASELATALPADPLVLSDVQASAYIKIDEQAGLTRKKYITDTVGQDATYLSKASDAEAYKAAGYPSASIASYPWVKAEAQALYGIAPTIAQYQLATDSIIATKAQWSGTIGPAIELQRRAGKLAVSSALTVSAAQTAEATAIAALKAL